MTHGELMEKGAKAKSTMRFGAQARTNLLLACLLGAMAAVGFYLQSNTHLNHDISWILYSSKWLIEGASYGRDIIEPNPPLVWYLAFPSVIAAELFEVHLATSFRVFTLLVALGVLAAAHWFLEQDDETGSSAQKPFVLLVLGYWFFIGCYRDFGQREYFALVLSVPYLFLASAAIGNKRYGPLVSIAVGFAAGIGFALKPYFLVVPLLVEIFAIIYTRRLFIAFRLENWTIAATIVGYLAIVLVSAPDYLAVTVPMMQPIYWGYNNPLNHVLHKIVSPLMCFLIVMAIPIWRRPSHLQATVMMAAVGFLVSFFVQMKGFTYHAFPFWCLVTLIAALHIGRTFDSAGDSAGDAAGDATSQSSGINWVRLVSSLVLVALVSVNIERVVNWYGQTNLDNGPYASRTEALISAVDSQGPDGTFLALATHPYPAFPIALYADADWQSRTVAAFFLPAIAKLRDAGTKADQDDLEQIESRAHDLVLADLQNEPDVVLVDNYPYKLGIGLIEFDLLEFYMEDPRFADLWHSYREIEPVYKFRVFVRVD